MMAKTITTPVFSIRTPIGVQFHHQLTDLTDRLECVIDVTQQVHEEYIKMKDEGHCHPIFYLFDTHVTNNRFKICSTAQIK